MQHDRCCSDPFDIAIDTDNIANIHRTQESHGIHGHRGDTPFGNLTGQNTAGDIHLRHQPTAENIPAGVGVGGHRKRSGTQITARHRVFRHLCVFAFCRHQANSC